MFNALATAIVALVGLFAAGMGILGLAYPARMSALVAPWASPAGLWGAAGLRLVFSVALWFAAPASRTPLVFQILAAIALAAAMVLPLLGLDRFKALLAWWLSQPRALQRAWLAASTAFGAFLLWSALI